MDMSEAFERVRKANKSVTDIVVISKDNFMIRSSSGNIAKQQMTNLIHVVDQCRTTFKENDELTFVKLRTKRCEYLVVPDKEYMMVAILSYVSEG